MSDSNMETEDLTLERYIYNNTLARELKLPQFEYLSPQLDHRSALVDWIGYCCQTFELYASTKWLAVQLMDHFMDNYMIVEEQLELLALSCLQISAKCEEKELDIPRPQDLSVLTVRHYEDKICMSMELTVLNHFSWRVSLPTVPIFCDYYMKAVVDIADTLNGVPLTADTVGSARSVINQYLDTFYEIALKDIRYKIYKPSEIAAAITAAIRQISGFVPIWPLRLQDHTQYKLIDIFLAYSDLYEGYKKLTESDTRRVVLVDSSIDNSRSEDVPSNNGHVFNEQLSSGYGSSTHSPESQSIPVWH